MKRIVALITVAVVLMAVLGGCMDPTMAQDKWAWYIDAPGDWTLQINAFYGADFKQHFVSGSGEEGFDLSGIIGTDQTSWAATINKDAYVKVWYDGEKLHDGTLRQGDQIIW